LSETIGAAAARLLHRLDERRQAPACRIIHFPRTSAGRENLRQALAILRDIRPAPSPLADADWDRLPDGAA